MHSPIGQAAIPLFLAALTEIAQGANHRMQLMAPEPAFTCAGDGQTDKRKKHVAHPLCVRTAPLPLQHPI